jgi:hypothetical protein
MNPPYPNLPPNTDLIPIVGDRHRTCFVVEFRCLAILDELQKIAIREKMEAYAKRILSSEGIIESCLVAADFQFDKPLSAALKLKR